METEKKYFEISWATLWKVSIFIIFLLLFYFAAKILAVLLLAIMVSSALNPFVSFLESKRIPRLLGSLLAFLTAFSFLGFVLYTLLPVAITELRSFLSQIDEIAITVFGFEIPEEILNQFSPNSGQFLPFLTDNGFSLVNVISSLFGGIFLTLSGIIISFYFTVEKNGVEKFLRAVLPETYENTVLGILAVTKDKIGRWFQAQLLLSLAVGIAAGVGLKIIGVKYSLFLGMLAGLLEILPIVGPIFAGTIAILISLATNSLWSTLYVLILFVIIQQLENQILVPFVMGKAVGLHPVVVLIYLLIGGYLAGFIGILLAVPAAVAVQEIINLIAARKNRRKSRALV